MLKVKVSDGDIMSFLINRTYATVVCSTPALDLWIYEDAASHPNAGGES